MPTKRIVSESSPQVQQLRTLWEELIQMQPRLHASMPVAVAQAQEKLMRQNPNTNPEFGKVILFGFYLLGSRLAQRAEPISMREVSELLTVPMSSATRVVDTLVENGFVERLHDAQDRRVVRIALTAQGQTLFETFVEFFDRRLAEFLSHFDAHERAQLLTLFSKTVTVLHQMNFQQ